MLHIDTLPQFTSPLESIFTLIFWSVAFFQLFWLFFFYIRIAFHKETEKVVDFLPISVIISARNEEENLMEFLPTILEQDYLEFEVIVVNHQSIDETDIVLDALSKRYPHLRIIHLERNNHPSVGKKLPITIAVKGAKYEHLLLTDADCQPSSNQWLKLMARKFTPKKKVVLGYGPYRKTNGFLNRFIRLDTTFIALNYLSYAKAGTPYMGVGRNLGYTKQTFMDNSGFKSHYSLPSGDDDLFIQEVAKDKNYTICLAPETFCYSEGEKSWSDWIYQKSRHYTTSGKYPLFKRLLLGIYPLTLLLYYISFVILLLNNGMNWITLGIFAFVLLSKWIIIGKSFQRLKQKSFVWALPFWDLFYALIAPIIYYTSEQANNSKWR